LEGVFIFMIQREAYMSRIRPFIGNDLIKVLTGVRRSGKSVMLELIQAELTAQGISGSQFIKLNFEDMDNAWLRTAETLHKEVTQRMAGIEGKVYLFFDEIQEVLEWEKCVNSLRVKFDCDIYITGSNAKLLSGELATYLAGRYVEFIIYPFSFGEFLELYTSIFPEAQQKEAFTRYMTLGGMPYLGNLRYEESPSQIYLQDLFNSVVLKDIVKRNKVRNVDQLERIIAYLFNGVGTTFSAASISKYFKNENRVMAPETVMNYINYCMNAFLIYQVRRQDLQGKKLLAVNEKYYIADHGLREAVYGGNMKDVNLILENIVFMELLRRGYKVTVGKTGSKEIDFICENKRERLYVQVTYFLASEETIQREFGAYEPVRDNFPKYVVSLDEFDMSREGIKHKNIRDFLLASEWN
jgi:predicted AAA+ superfamily ATPase